MDGDKKKKKRVGYGMDFRKLIKKRKTKRSKNVEEWEIGLGDLANFSHPFSNKISLLNGLGLMKHKVNITIQNVLPCVSWYLKFY